LAKSALAKWSGSLEIVLRSVPEARVLVTIASNVVEKKNMGHFLSRLQKDPYSRQKMAEVVQISQQLIFKVKSKLVPRVVFAEACTASELQVTTGKSGILPAIIEQASRLMDDPFLVSEQSV
jgi:hypothetical protein